jgi:hypothetical protein
MPNKYHKETVVLETDQGTARDEEHLWEVWEFRIKKYFPHYKIIDAAYEANRGKTKNSLRKQ